MAYTSRCETVRIRHTPEIFDERPIDGEFVLPEYCPDIAAILKCFVIPTVSDRQRTGTHLGIDGQVHLRVLYVGEDREQVYCCEFTVPYAASVAVSEELHVYSIHHRVEYVNCRAAGPRRIEVHGAFRIHVACCAAKEMPVLTEIAGNDVFVNTCTVQCTEPIGSTEKCFTVNEIIDVASASEPIRRLIYTRATPILAEYKQLSGKAILKGELLVFALYYCQEEQGVLRQLEQSIPFSQIIDAECISEDSVDDVFLEVDSADMRSAVDPSGENTLLSVNCKLSVHILCSHNKTVQAIGDAFCRAHPLQLDVQELALKRTTLVRRESHTIRQTVELPTDDIIEILSVWCDLLQPGDGDGKGRMQLSMLCKNSSNAVSFYERPLDFRLDLPENAGALVVYNSIRHTEYSVNGRSMELRVELCCRCHYCETANCTVGSAVAVNEELRLPVEPCGVKLYFAEAGETLWEIAKYCRTSREAVIAENDLAEEVLSESRMLLIPVV